MLFIKFYFQDNLAFKFVKTIEEVIDAAFDGDDGDTLTTIDAEKLAGIHKL